MLNTTTTPFPEPDRVIPEPRPKLTVRWYRPSELLPAVSSKRVSDAVVPAAPLQSAQPILTTTPDPTPSPRFTYTEAPKPRPETPTDPEVPNVIATAAPPPKKTPKEFVPPPKPAPTPANRELELSPFAALSPNGSVVPEELRKLAAEPIAKLQPRKAKLPPPQTKASPKQPNLMVEPPPEQTVASSKLPRNIPSPDLGAIAPPPPAPPKQNSSSLGNATVTAASINPASMKKATDLPETNRSGNIASGPNLGNPASGEIKVPGPEIPGLTIVGERNPRATNIPKNPPQGMEEAVQPESRYLARGPTLSVPLRPSSRLVPASIEALFRGKNIYTIVIPAPILDWYDGDWILWFAEMEGPAETPLIRAPLPRRRNPAPRPAAASQSGVRRVQALVRIDKTGKLEVIRIVDRQPADILPAVSFDLTRWEFSPATKNGAPIDVEGVVEIPYKFPPVSRPRQP